MTLYFIAGTNFVNMKDVNEDQHARVADMLANLENTSFKEVKEKALTDYKNLFDKISLSLPTTPNSYLSTDERMQKKHKPLQILNYHLYAITLKGTQPENLQENPPERKGYHYFFDEVAASYYFTTIAAKSTIDRQILKNLFS